MQHTTIEWVKNVDGTQGYSCNPMTGCLNCIDGKCGGLFPCYAYLQSHGRCHQQDLKGIPVEYYGEDSFVPRIHPDRFQQLLNAPRGAGIFVDDRSDWVENTEVADKTLDRYSLVWIWKAGLFDAVMGD